MSLNFACKTLSINDIISCSFGLSKAETKVLKRLLSSSAKTAEQIAKLLKKDRTTIQRTLISLLNKKLIIRRQMNLDSGGYTFYYTPIDKEEIKKRILSNFELFKSKLDSELSNW